MARISRERDLELDQAYERLTGVLGGAPITAELAQSARSLVLRLRSRLINLATIKAEYEPEYALRLQQAKVLIAAGAAISEEWKSEFN